MGLKKIFERFYPNGWVNSPYKKTPIVAEALNNYDEALIAHDEALLAHDEKIENILDTLQASVLNIPDGTYSLLEYLKYLYSLGKNSVSIGNFNNFSDKSEIASYINTNLKVNNKTDKGSWCDVMITYSTRGENVGFYTLYMFDMWSTSRFDNGIILSTLYNEIAGMTSNADIYARFRAIPWMSDVILNSQVVNNLTSQDAGKPLSANMGRELKSQIDSTRVMSGYNWNAVYDLIPSGGNLARLGGCYVSGSAESYHAPETGFAFAFGERPERYGMIFVGKDSKKMYYKPYGQDSFIQLANQSDLDSMKFGGKVLAFETDGTASTYRIRGSADASPLTIEIVADMDTSTGIIPYNIYSYTAIIRDGLIVKNQSNTSSMSTQCGTIQMESTAPNGLLISNKSGYILRVWVMGSGWSVEKVL